MEYRLESDSIGTKKVPLNVYYGVQTLRASENFHITGIRMCKEFTCSIVKIKKAAAIANFKAGMLNKNIADAIIKSCNEILLGKLMDQFIVDSVQGGAGTSFNMNVNEVIANRAIEILGCTKGNYNIVSPNDHVNMGQSTNDVIPTAGKMTAIMLLKNLEKKLEKLENAIQKKADEFDDVIKMGRTQLQDAVPIRLGQEFGAYSCAVKRDIKRIKKAEEELSIVNLGGTAIGTGLNANEKYFRSVVPILNSITGFDLKQAEDLIDATQNLDGFVFSSGVLKNCAVDLSKMANDLRLMSSGPRTGLEEINLPPKQNGSSIMPGKVNPVIPEVINQISFSVIGNDVSITMAAEAGQFELNAFEPIIFYKLFESIEMLTNGLDTFTENCIMGITANRKRCRELAENSAGIVTAVSPYIGYKRAADIAKKAVKTGESVKNIILKENVLKDFEVDKILNIKEMTYNKAQVH